MLNDARIAGRWRCFWPGLPVAVAISQTKVWQLHQPDLNIAYQVKVNWILSVFGVCYCCNKEWVLSPFKAKLMQPLDINKGLDATEDPNINIFEHLTWAWFVCGTGSSLMIYLLVYLLVRKKTLVIIFSGVVNPGVTPPLPMYTEWTYLPLVQDITWYHKLYLPRREKLCLRAAF